MSIFLTRFLIATVFAGSFLTQPLAAATYPMNGDVVGAVRSYTVKNHDSLAKIARHFDLGMVELLAANPGITTQNLRAGTILIVTNSHVLPRPHTGIVINLPELRLFYFLDSHYVMTFPIGIGREGWDTPLGVTRIAIKREKPTWTPPDSIRAENPKLPRIVPAGPNNPLGNYALDLALPAYAIHGTNRPASVGLRSSHGCIRLYPEDIATLFHVVKVGTKVTIIDTPVKLGWQGFESLHYQCGVNARFFQTKLLLYNLNQFMIRS